MYKQFALTKKVQKFVLNGAAVRMTFNNISRRLNEVRCTSELVETKNYYVAHILIRKYAAAASQGTLHGALDGPIPPLPRSALVSGSGHQLDASLPRDKMIEAGERSKEKDIFFCLSTSFFLFSVNLCQFIGIINLILTRRNLESCTRIRDRVFS